MGGGMGGGTAASAASWGDVGMLEQPGGLGCGSSIDFGQLDRTEQKDELDWGILGEGNAGGAFDLGEEPASGGSRRPGPSEDDDDDDFTVFDGFRDNKPVLGGASNAGAKKASAGEGLSWDAERGLWKESKPRSAFASMTSGWDQRKSAFSTPSSLFRIRSQAEKVFDDAIGTSLFTSPSMVRFKKQTDDMFASLSSTFTSVTSVFTAPSSFFSSWFG
jgi:hypothetical protein